MTITSLIFFTMETKDTDIKNIWKKNGGLGVNISEKYKTFLWLWDKTGTSLAKEIFSHFNFCFYDVSTQPRKLISTSIAQAHFCDLFDGHEDLKMIATARNPYTRTFSRFRMSFPAEKITIENFRNFIEETIQSPNNYGCMDFSRRKPDYFVRIENLYQDYCKIPFVNESELRKKGILLIMCNNIVNKGKGDFFWKDFYTQPIADLVFYSSQQYFDLLNYDKNSWKK